MFQGQIDIRTHLGIGKLPGQYLSVLICASSSREEVNFLLELFTIVSSIWNSQFISYVDIIIVN